MAVTAGLNLAPIAHLQPGRRDGDAAGRLHHGARSLRQSRVADHRADRGDAPMGMAMEKTGAARLAAQYVTQYLGDYGPVMVMGGFFLFAVALTQTMVNAAVALLLTPIAINVAQQLHVNPRAFAMTIAIAHRLHSPRLSNPPRDGLRARPLFADFVRVGGILTICVMAVTFWSFPYFGHCGNDWRHTIFHIPCH